MTDRDPDPDRSDDYTTTDGGSSQTNETTLEGQANTVTYGEPVTDIHARPDTKPLLFQTIAIFGAVGIGYGLFGYFAVDAFVGGDDLLGGIGGIVSAFVVILIASLAGPVISIITTIRTNGLLAYLKDDLVFATAGVGAAIGQLALLAITILFSTAALPGEADVGLGDFLNLIILSMVITGIVAAVIAAALRKLDDPIKP